jgi:NADPH-dependent glutamate synthase beta subunit-like oxidoreductase
LQCSVPYLFTGGDVATGPSLVVSAIGGGRRAARSIHQYITDQEVKGSPNSLQSKRHIPESIFNSVPGVEKTKRTPMPELPVKDRIDSMIEVDQVISEADAKYEAGRCLNCCRVCYNPDVIQISPSLEDAGSKSKSAA